MADSHHKGGSRPPRHTRIPFREVNSSNAPIQLAHVLLKHVCPPTASRQPSICALSVQLSYSNKAGSALARPPSSLDIFHFLAAGFRAERETYSCYHLQHCQKEVWVLAALAHTSPVNMGRSSWPF